MHTITIPEAKNVIRHVVFEQNEPVFFWGGFGVGKSQAIAQAVADLHFRRNAEGVWEWDESAQAELIDIRLSQYDSVDLRGFPGVDDRGLTVWHAPSTLPFEGNNNFPDDVPIIVFFDEANAASPAVSAVAYQLINDRKCGEHSFKRNVFLVMAGNRESDKGVTNRQPLPLANRLTHYEITTDVKSVCDYAQLSGWPAIFTAFINFRKPLLNTYDPAKPEKTIATPRTWEKAMKYYTAKMPQATKMASMAGAVGDGPAAEFWGFVDVWGKVKEYMPDILKRPSSCDLPDEPSMQYAVTVSVSGEMNLQNLHAYHTFMMRMPPEFTVLCWQLAVKRDEDLFGTPEFVDFSKKYRVLFT
jgi:hypothetical protein